MQQQQKPAVDNSLQTERITHEENQRKECLALMEKTGLINQFVPGVLLESEME